MLKVLGDILRAIDRGDITALTLLDLSAAFDTVDHQILLRRLKTSYGLVGSALDWFASYLDGRTQFVRCGTRWSTPGSVLCGVPQGSVLGPILFLLYTAELLRLIEDHDLHPHLYADDTQIYGSCQPKPCDVAQLESSVSLCVNEVASWMRSNRLQLNTAKTEVLWCSSPFRQHELPARRSWLAMMSSHQSAASEISVYISIPTFPCGLTLPRPCRAVFPLYVRFAASVGPSRNQSCCHL